MNKRNSKNAPKPHPLPEEERGAQGRFADDVDNRARRSGESHQGRSQGGNGLSQKHDRMEEVYRKTDTSGH